MFPFSLPCGYSLYPQNDLLFEESEQASTQILNYLFGLFHLVYSYIVLAWVSRGNVDWTPSYHLFGCDFLVVDSLSSFLFPLLIILS